MKAEDENTNRPEGDAHFSALVWRLAIEARAFLGEELHPDVEKLEPKPELAKQSIDTLAMLKGKTEGNRTEAETEMLEGVLYELRMQFLQSTGKPAVDEKTDEQKAEPDKKDDEAQEDATPDPGKPAEPDPEPK